MDAGWHIQLLGTFAATNPAGQAVRFRTRKAAALLAYLAFYQGRACPREALIALFWPESAPEIGRHNLRMALSFLRATLGATVFESDRNHVRLKPEGVTTDLAVFEGARAQARCATIPTEKVRWQERAWDTYRGSLLSGDYESWIVPQALRLEEGYIQTVVELVAGLRALGRQDRAHQVLEQSRTLLPECDELHALQAVKPTPPLPVPSPAPRDRFFGRASELGQLEQLLTERRLITLIGPGGSGKTRLAQALTARTTQPTYFVPLVDIASAEQLPDAIHAALGLPRAPHRVVREQVIEALTTTAHCLVLDNVEHLLPAVADVVQRLLDLCPQLHLLLTSRLPCGVPDEILFPVGPLALPDAIAIFVDRAQRAHPAFTPRHENRRAIEELCTQLDCLPLALELAAAQAALLSPAQMLAAISERFTFLVRPRASGNERHRSLRTVLDWSFDQLAPALQRRFAQLSVLRGSFTAAEVAAVTEESNPLAPLAQLQCAALIVTEDNGETVRFRLLETLRAFGEEKLSPAERTVLAARHAHWFLSQAETWDSQLSGATLPAALTAFTQAQDNIHAALRWANRHEPALGLRLAVALGRFGTISSQAQWAKAILQEALAACPDAPARLRCQALDHLCWFCYETADARCAPLNDDAHALAQQCADPALLSSVLAHRALIRFAEGNYAETAAVAEEALHHAQRADRPDRQGVALHHLAAAHNLLGNLDQAAAYCRTSIVFLRTSGELYPLAYALVLLAFIETDRGDFALAEVACREGLALHRRLGCLRGVAYALRGMGGFAWYAGRYDEAEGHHTESQQLFTTIGDRGNAARQWAFVGWAQVGQEALGAAWASFAQGYAQSREHGSRFGTAQAAEGLGLVALRRGDPEDARRYLRVSLEGYEAVHAPVSSLVPLELLACVIAPSAPERAVALLGGCHAYRRVHHSPRIDRGPGEVAALEATLPQQLGQERFDHLFHAGEALPWDALVELALTD